MPFDSPHVPITPKERLPKGTISVGTGLVFATSRKVVLRSDGIGSCVVVAAYDPQKRIGALAHIMLPGKSTKKDPLTATKHARDAVSDMLFKMVRLGALKKNLEACLVGGANVLKDKNDRISAAVLLSVTEILTEESIKIVAKAVGGEANRWMYLDIEDGAVCYTAHGCDIELLYQWKPAGDDHG